MSLSDPLCFCNTFRVLELISQGFSQPIRLAPTSIKTLFLFFLQLDPNDLNNTKNAKKEILFFNRVPKVGSDL